MADASTVPGIATCCRTMDATLAAVMPVGAVDALERPTSHPKRAQSWPWMVTLSVPMGWTPVVFEWHERTLAKQATRAAKQQQRYIGTQRFESSGLTVRRSMRVPSGERRTTGRARNGVFASVAYAGVTSCAT